MAQAQTYTAVWDANTDGNTAGYRLYYGTSSGNYSQNVDAGNATSYRLPALAAGQTHYFVVRAYNAAGAVGPASNETSVTPGSTLPTAQITATYNGAGGAAVSWQTSNATAVSINGVAVAASGSATTPISVTTTFTITATGTTGTATASATAVVPTISGPGAPGRPTASVSASRVSLRWAAPTTGSAPAGYRVYVGTAAGASNIANGLDVGNALGAAGDLNRGTYYVRVAGYNAAGLGAMSPEASFRIGKSRPRRPGTFTATAAPTGSVSFAWTAPVADAEADAPTAYVLEAGSAPGLSNLAVMPVGDVVRFTTTAPPGVYYVRVRAMNEEGPGDPSDEVVVRIGTPGRPAGLVSSGAGSTVNLNWKPAAGGAAASGYVVEAGSAPGLADLAVMPVGNVLTFSTAAPPGTYYVRVRAANGAGGGEASNEIVVRR